MQNFDILNSKGLFLLCSSLKILRQGVGSSICLALMIINSKVVTREFLSPADLSGAQTLCVYMPTEVVIVGNHQNFMLKTL